VFFVTDMRFTQMWAAAVDALMAARVVTVWYRLPRLQLRRVLR